MNEVVPRLTSSISKKSSTSKNRYYLLCTINSRIYSIPFKKIYLSTSDTTCVELKKMIIWNKQFIRKFGIVACLEKITIIIRNKIIKSSDLIGKLKNNMRIEIKITTK